MSDSAWSHEIDLETRLAAKLFMAPDLAAEALSESPPSDFLDPDLGLIAETISRLAEAGTAVTVEAVSDELQRRAPRGNGSGWIGRVSDLVDEPVLELSVSDTAKRIHRHALERERTDLYRRLATEPDNLGYKQRLRWVEEALEADERVRAKRAHPLEAVSFSGKRLLALLQRPMPLPVEAARPVPGHFSLWVAPSFTGKTSLSLWNGMSRAAGVAPWSGVEARPPGRVLIYSLDEAPEQVMRRMNGLSLFHPAGSRLERYVHNIVVVGPDRDLDPSELDALRFDENGLETLTRWIEEARKAGEPFAEVYIDAYADVLPLGQSENSNEEATRIGGALERRAVRFGPAITLLHHCGKPKADAGEDLPDVRFMGRGASALAAKARAVTSLELVAGMPNLRRVRTATNLGPAPKPVLFEVCSGEATAEELIFFRPAADASERDPHDFLKPGESISTRDLARRLAGDSLEEDAEPKGDLKRLAASLREAWRKAGKVIVSPGPRNAKMMRLSDPAEAE